MVFYVLVLQRNILAVYIDIAGQDHDAFHQSPYAGNKGAEAAGEHSDEKLRHRFAGITQIKIMNAEAAEENSRRPAAILLFCILGSTTMGAGAA